MKTSTATRKYVPIQTNRTSSTKQQRTLCDGHKPHESVESYQSEAWEVFLDENVELILVVHPELHTHRIHHMLRGVHLLSLQVLLYRQLAGDETIQGTA